MALTPGTPMALLNKNTLEKGLEHFITLFAKALAMDIGRCYKQLARC
jgi:hypothetical protein